MLKKNSVVLGGVCVPTLKGSPKKHGLHVGTRSESCCLLSNSEWRESTGWVWIPGYGLGKSHVPLSGKGWYKVSGRHEVEWAILIMLMQNQNYCLCWAQGLQQKSWITVSWAAIRVGPADPMILLRDTEAWAAINVPPLKVFPEMCRPCKPKGCCLKQMQD